MPMTTLELAEELASRERNERERRRMPTPTAPHSRYPGEMQADWAVEALRAKRKS